VSFFSPPPSRSKFPAYFPPAQIGIFFSRFASISLFCGRRVRGSGLVLLSPVFPFISRQGEGSLPLLGSITASFSLPCSFPGYEQPQSLRRSEFPFTHDLGRVGLIPGGPFLFPIAATPAQTRLRTSGFSWIPLIFPSLLNSSSGTY